MRVIYSLEDLIEDPSIEIGSVIHANYETATVLTNDSLIHKAGGLPLRTFLLAVPKAHGATRELREVLLLSVASTTTLDSDRQNQSLREEIARTGRGAEDIRTKESLQTLGFKTEIVGTFYKDSEGTVRFGGDVDRVRGESAFRIYKPRGKALSLIASYSHALSGSSEVNESLGSLKIGRVRYTETEQNVDSGAEVFINIKDFIGKKSAVFGITRSGKSNTIKLIAQKIFTYSHLPGKEPVGQIIFDPQGEYANVNSQDGNSALAEIGQPGDVHIYKMLNSDEKETEKVKHLQFNLFDTKNANLFWKLMTHELNNSISSSSNYIASLESIFFFKSNPRFDSEQKIELNNRKLLGLYALAGNSLPEVHALADPFEITVGDANVPLITSSFEELESKSAGKIEVHTTEAALNLLDWIILNENSLPADLKQELTKGVLTPFKEQIIAQREGKNGVLAAFRRAIHMHHSEAVGDVREKIWRDLEKGRLVIVDLSKGSSRTTTNLSELIVQHLVSQASERFTKALPNVNFQIIVEEAHNLFSRDGQKDEVNDPWVRLSKEASKYGIGLVYATQEITSVDPRILSNTSNWIVAHLNSRKELSELARYYNFETWSNHLLKVETKGFVRMKTESSPYIVPVQVDLFRAQGDPAALEAIPVLSNAEAASNEDIPDGEIDFSALPF